MLLQKSYTKDNDELVKKVITNFQYYLSLNERKTNQRIQQTYINFEKPLTLLLAVSGGIDSQVMLHAVHTIFSHTDVFIKVVTVNHNLREEIETAQDALFVKEYCERELNTHCDIITIERGFIDELNRVRGCGVEDAARHERYTRIFEYAKKYNAKYVLFAHNRDDQLETLVQHFLQGACAGISGYASSGIQQLTAYPLSGIESNDISVFRPLLSVSRKEIEVYAKSYSIPYREDSTNSQLVFYRNKIRHNLIPILNKHFVGWDTGVLAGAEKAFLESNFIETLAKSFSWDVDNNVSMSLHAFFNAGFPVRIRLLYKGLELAGIKGRIPYAMIKLCAQGQKRVQGLGFEIVHKAEKIIIRKLNVCQFDTSAFFLNITQCGQYYVGTVLYQIQESVQKIQMNADIERGENCIGMFKLPICIRNRKAGDKIITAQGTHKSVKKIFSEWRVAESDRLLIPFIESEGQLVCIWGAVYGYPNWYVKQQKIEQSQMVYIRFIRNN